MPAIGQIEAHQCVVGFSALFRTSPVERSAWRRPEPQAVRARVVRTLRGSFGEGIGHVAYTGARVAFKAAHTGYRAYRTARTAAKIGYQIAKAPFQIGKVIYKGFRS